MVLGNKCDINDKRQVSKDRGEKVRNFVVIGLYLIINNNIVALLRWYNVKKNLTDLVKCILFQLALEYGIKFMETSAKANINVENVSSHSSLNYYDMLNRSYVINVTTCVFVLIHSHF